MIFKRTKSLCKECPLRSEKRVWGTCDIEKPAIAFLGEAPGEREAEEGKPFVGPAGKWLRSAVSESGLMFHAVWKMNVISCRPPKNDIESFEAQEARRCCLPGFEEEMQFLRKLGVRIISPLGNTASHSLGIDGTITKIRGSVYILEDYKPMIALPTFHPSFIMRGMLKEEGTWVADIMKVRDLSRKKYVPPKENFNINPTLKDLEEFADGALKSKSPLGVDIETTSLNPWKSKIVVVGLASSSEDAISIPFLRKGGLTYWNGSEKKAVAILKDILSECPTIFQNCLFDIRHLEEKGFLVRNLKHDILLIHSAVHPELPHNLGYITSIYGTTPYWKGEFSGRDGSILSMEDDTLRTYNLRDSVVLHQVLEPLLKDLKETGTESIYENISMKLVDPILQMQRNGIPFSIRKQEAFKKQLTKDHIHLEKELQKVGRLPSGFNLSSSDHMRAFLFGIYPTSYIKAKEELTKYDANPKLKKNTKKYGNLVSIEETFRDLVPLYPLKSFRKTDGGDPATDKEAVLSLQRMLNNRLAAIKDFRKPSAKHAEEIQSIKSLHSFLVSFGEYKKVEKLLTTYVDLPIQSDGKVHPEYLIHGTRTGRLSSRNPNGQNLTSEVKKLFTSEDGWYFIQGDYSNLELRVLAYVAEDDVLMDAFDAGLNIHDINCKLLFEIDESHPLWKAARKAAKIYIFGRNYGGSLNGVYEQVLKEVPQLNLTLAQFQKIDDKYRKAHPRYAEWYDSVVREVTQKRVLTTVFGRKRIFLGTESEIIREGLNTQIQSPAADITNGSLIQMSKLTGRNFHLLGTIHDSILVSTPKANLKKAVSAMRLCMEREVRIGKHKVKFPVDFEYGECWGELKPYEEK